MAHAVPRAPFILKTEMKHRNCAPWLSEHASAAASSKHRHDHNEYQISTFHTKIYEELRDARQRLPFLHISHPKTNVQTSDPSLNRVTTEASSPLWQWWWR
jgi:hypothetical protein